MMKSNAFIVRCCFVLLLRKGEWNELTGHPKDPWKELAEFEDVFFPT
jgi:hypothetical protein